MAICYRSLIQETAHSYTRHLVVPAILRHQLYYLLRCKSDRQDSTGLLYSGKFCHLHPQCRCHSSSICDHRPRRRRPLLLASTTVMTAMSLLISVGLTLSVSFLLVTATFVYIAAFAIGLGPIPFLIIGELSYPQDAATAQSFGTVCNWLATFIVGYLFPIGHGLMAATYLRSSPPSPPCLLHMCTSVYPRQRARLHTARFGLATDL